MSVVLSTTTWTVSSSTCRIPQPPVLNAAGLMFNNALGWRCHPSVVVAWLDVLIDAEEVLRIPLVLQRHELGVLLCAVACSHPLLPPVGLEVQVHGPGREGSHRLGESSDPVDVPL